MATIKINGAEYEKLAVAGTKEKITEYCKEYLWGTDVELNDDGRFIRKSDGKPLSLYGLWKGKRIYLLTL